MKCIAKITLTISDEHGNAILLNSEEYKEWANAGGHTVGNVRALMAYDYKFLGSGSVGVEDDIYLKGPLEWKNKDFPLMIMTRECFEKYFIPVE